MVNFEKTIIMKRKNLLLTLIISAAILTSCGGNSNNDNTTEEDKGILEQVSGAAESLKGLSKLEEQAKKMEERTNELKSLTPVSNDVFKAVLPENFEGLVRKSLNLGDMSAFGFAQGEASYRNEESTKDISVRIMDGAGEGASAIISLVMLGINADKEEITETGFEKTAEIDGQRAIISEETYNDEKNSSIQAIYADRFLINLDGRGYSLEELTAFYKKLNLSGLK